MSKQLVISLAICVMLVSFLGVTQAQTDPVVQDTIHILPDGTVTPSTAPIRQSGENYKATANINTSIVIERSNIVLDGQGFTIKGTGGNNKQAAINLTCTGTIVENFVVDSWQVGVLGVFDNNQVIGNQFHNNNQDIAVYGNNYRVAQNFVSYIRIQGTRVNIEQNEVRTHGYVSAFWISQSRDIVIQANNLMLTNYTASFISTDNNSTIQVYHNNFLSQLLESRGQFYLFGMSGLSDLAPWDNGYPSGGNYWSDYSARYSNASETNSVGIWNTEYLIKSGYNWSLVDRYPLTEPYTVQVAALPAPPPNGGIDDNPTPSVPELPVWVMLMLLATAAFAMIGLKKENKERSYFRGIAITA